MDTVATTVSLSFECGSIASFTTLQLGEKILPAITVVLVDRSESEKCALHVSVVIWFYF